MAARLFLFDSFGFLFRAYHARARSAAPPMRTQSGLQTEAVFIFHNMLRRMLDQHQPAYVAAVFESEGPTLREQEYADYKANRAETPDELLQQIPYVRRLLDAMKVPVLEFPGYEADDVIGTLARRAADAGCEVVIVSSDKDMLQLVNNHVRMVNPAKNDEWYDPAKVEEFLGVAPSQVADLLALKGDSVDNIPGAPGIGDKGARDLIREFGSVEAAMDRAAEVQRKSYRESLENHRPQIELSKRLATIATDVPIEYNLEALAGRQPDEEALRELFTELEFFSLLKELKATQPSEAPSLRLIGSKQELTDWLAALPKDAPVAVALGMEGEGLLAIERMGLASHAGEGIGLDAEFFSEAKPLLEDVSRPKIAHDSKALMVELARKGIEARGFTADVMLYAFLLSADPGSSAPDVIASRYLNRKPGPAVEEAAANLIELARRLAGEIDERGFGELYETIDLPMASILARMERTGIRIQRAALAEMSAAMESEIERLSQEIYSIAGQVFNINSPQQLSKVLFDDLGLPTPFTRSKKKAPSTAADVLETLADEFPIARLVLEYRQLAKLKGTYADALPALIHPSTGRLHTTFNLAGAATGRLSSSNPNLQNIPIRTELGRGIRAAFVPEPGWKLVVADYSQIELRLLAHFSRDPVLVDAFRRGEDIHTRTAAEVFGVAPLEVTPELRRNAKAVNFGIVYGLSAFGLAGQLGITRGEAESYISGYFERYKGVKRFIEETISEVQRTGVTRTLFGRERPIPDINSRNPNARGFAERTAVNTPLQGTASDLIKRAMIRIQAKLDGQKMQSRMLLQVHDELVFEAPPEELDELRRIAQREMEAAHELEVPLVAETGAGDNWRDAK
ncbi:MAG: DNA polymerase I [Acidimicrobiia bacterium]|nr:DNA polymerase I [Acidimicrobiia bacterium]